MKIITSYQKCFCWIVILFDLTECWAVNVNLSWEGTLVDVFDSLCYLWWIVMSFCWAAFTCWIVLILISRSLVLLILYFFTGCLCWIVDVWNGRLLINDSLWEGTLVDEVWFCLMKIIYNFDYELNSFIYYWLNVLMCLIH